MNKIIINNESIQILKPFNTYKINSAIKYGIALC